MALLHCVVTQGIRPQIKTDRPEGFSEINLINFGKFLTAYDNHAMVKPDTIDLSRHFRADWFGKVNANDLRTTGIR